MSARTKVFILSDWFVPGYRAGGPITSLYRMCAQLHGDVDFFVLTNNHDWHEQQAYDLPSEQWVEQDGIQVFYTAHMGQSLLDKLIREVNPDVLYWNGIYSPKFHALPLTKNLLGTKVKRLIVAPRGMLNPNAIALKSTKKRLLLQTFKALRIVHKVMFHSTSNKETAAILSVFPKAKIQQLSNLPPAVEEKEDVPGSNRSGLISVGRISPVKNTLKLLQTTDATAHPLTMVGSYDDPNYFDRCKALIAKNDQVFWIEGRPPSEMPALLKKHKFFITLTTGENFGHAIIEALAAGCPVIISDQTPWNDLEEYGAGWVLPLDDQQGWIKRIDACMRLDQESYTYHSKQARSYVSTKFDQEALRKQYLKLFTGEN